MIRPKYIKLVVILMLILSQAESINAENLRRLVNLKGEWKFSIGDDTAWASPNVNDSDWESVFVPNSWEENGFKHYNGFAWYRKTFQIGPIRQKYLYLHLGYIDDVDEVYVNGKLVGATGDFPPLVKTAHNVPRMYPIPVDLINKNGKNVVAVRVYDEYHNGGIMRGLIGIFENADQHRMDVDLTGYWNFETSRTIDKGNLKCSTYKKGKIFVPGFWESRGYNDCDGQAMYTKNFVLPASVSTSNKALVLGIIDDTDEVYLNGKKLKWIRHKNYSNKGSNYNIFRAYPIPESLLTEGINRVEVEVNDFMGPGGIYSGPIGICDLNFAKELVQREFKDNRSTLEKLWDSFWD